MQHGRAACRRGCGGSPSSRGSRPRICTACSRRAPASWPPASPVCRSRSPASEENAMPEGVTSRVRPGNGLPVVPAPEAGRKVAIICSKSSLDMVYPGLILANAARLSGIDAMLFFTFWGLDIVTEKKVDHLHFSPVGNPSVPFPTMVAGLPGMESLATRMMKGDMSKLDIPGVREFLQLLSDSGAR